MRIAVSGSIATDHLMTFGGKFTDTLIAEKLDKISVSFLVGDLEIRRGGVAGNIAYGLGCLGLKPLLVGCVGPDFADYRSWLEDHGVDTSGVRTSATRQTARFTATNDEAGNQIASFYPGAMSEDGEIDITSLAAANGGRPGADRGGRPGRDAAAHGRLPRGGHPVRGRLLAAGGVPRRRRDAHR